MKIYFKSALMVALIVLIIGAGFFIYTKVQEYTKKESGNDIKTQEILEANQKALSESSKALEDTRNQLEQLKKDTEKAVEKNNDSVSLLNKEIDRQNRGEYSISESLTIGATEMGQYLTSIGQIQCFGDNPVSGSGSIWRDWTGLQGLWVLTNRHVITTKKCAVFIESGDPGIIYGAYSLDVVNAKAWNNTTDVMMLKIGGSFWEESVIKSKPLSGVSSNISNLKFCNVQMAIGSPVVVIGYPAFSETNNSYGTESHQSVTEGVISSYDTSTKKPVGLLPEADYFVSNKIDSGNSGGIALAKDKDGLCVLGIPTWLSFGRYENQGMVQNIHNILYIGK